jgi:hypothetical protein
MDVLSEAQRHPFRAVHWAAPAQAHQDIRVHLSGTRGGGKDIWPRRMLRNRIEYPSEARSKDRLQTLEQIGLGGNRRACHDEGPLTT